MSEEENRMERGARRPSSAEHPVALGSLGSWASLLRRSDGIDRRYIPRALFVTLTTLLTGPFRLWEKARYSGRIRAAAIHPAPLFIIGHWRSGTTHLQNLLCQDSNLGYLSTFQAMAPGFCLVGDPTLKRLLARLANGRYPTRLIDNIPLAFDAPQEDEFALANLLPYAFVHTFSLPRQAEEMFARSVLFDGLSEAERARWRDTYLALLRKASLANRGRRLVVKNCAHTARIPALLELFPDAKFIHIHRNPYHVFLSTLHMHRTVLPRSQLQAVCPEQVEAHVLRFYGRLMRKFLADRASIPAGNLVEMRFEDLERSPLEELRRVYDALRLPGFSDAEPGFRAYVHSVTEYRKNTYRLDSEVIAKVNEHWLFAFDRLGYDRLDPSDAGGQSASA